MVKEPGRLLPQSLSKERQMVEARRQGYAVERALLLADLDNRGDAMGGSKGRRLRENSRPEHLRSLFEQVASLDHMLTSLESQIEVLTAVQTAVPKDLTDTFHDSGTSGHEPDSLEAIQTVVSGGGGGQQQNHHHHLHHHHQQPRLVKPQDDEDDDEDEEEDSGGDAGEEEEEEEKPAAVVGTIREEGRAGDAAVLLHLERSSHRKTRRSLQELREKYDVLRRELTQRDIHVEEMEAVRTVGSALEDLHIQQERNQSSLESLSSIASSERLVDELKVREMTISQLRTRLLQLEKDRLDKVPVDAAREITRLNSLLVDLERARDELTLQNASLKTRLSELTAKIHDPAATYQITRDSLASDTTTITTTTNAITKTRGSEDPDVTKVLRKATFKLPGDSQKLRTMLLELTAKEEEYRARIATLEEKLMNYENEDAASAREHERTVRSLEHQLEISSQKLEAAGRYATAKEEESSVLKLDLDTLNEENRRLKESLNDLILKQREVEELAREKLALEEQFTRLQEENRVLAEDFNRERVLRKKYYNQVEEMKGKIRVFCRVRPVSESEARRGGAAAEKVVGADDPFTVSVESQRGHKAFLFDRVFQPHDSQDEVFADTNALIQSTLDGFNVTIMAYGQTGSGKTYTMIGTEAHPGIAPRAFQRLFQLIEAGRSRYTVQASTYMMELYNDKLIDLLRPPGSTENDKLDIKKDKKGSVHVQGAVVRSVSSAVELTKAFQEGLTNRHTAATKMNVESSRSHLLIIVCLNITSKQTGSVLKGKLTLVDLAGSERVSKSGASADQLREANSINKSLSALGDVISALSSESSFVPYRNSKLTMLLQDSLGGNSKTLVFVNVSPVAHNADETLVSLMYASRIKQITNSVSKNSDNKEISRLKSIINKLRKGEDLDEDIT